MIASIARLFFILALTTSTAAGCSTGRRLGSSLVEDSHGNDTRDLQDIMTTAFADVDDEYSCGFQTPSVEDQLEAATMVGKWKHSHGRKLQSLMTTSYTIPVYFWHTYSPGSTSDKILTKEFIEQNHFATILHAFRETPFVFELKGIEIVESAAFGRCERLQQNEYDMKKTLRVAGKNVLNIYICDNRSSDSSAWASPPITADIDPLYDGVVLRNTRLVSSAKAINTIMNANHEVGHWLGLLHTFEGGCSPKIYNTPEGVQTQGDGVDDTPQQSGPTKDLPGADVCWIFDPPLDTCKDLSNGVNIGPDAVHNIMNYISGECQKEHGEFTNGQIERMVAQYETFRMDSICRPSKITCTSSSQCCDGMICKGGNDMKMKCH